MNPRTLQVLGEALIAAAEKLRADENADKLLARVVSSNVARLEAQDVTAEEAARLSDMVPAPPVDNRPLVPDDCTELFDALGRSWSAEVHSGGKRINKGDGRWTLKRGVTREQEDAYFAAQGTVTPEAAVAAATSATPLTPPEAAAPVSHGKGIQDIAIAAAKLCEGGATNHPGIDLTVSRALFGDAATDGGLAHVFSAQATPVQLDVVWATLLDIAKTLGKEL